MSNPILVEVLRGGQVESRHRGTLAIVDADGAVRAAIGDIERAVFPRSAVKVLQALPLVASGAAERLALTDAELALACASHRGEPLHAKTAASMLAKAGVDETCLECGSHWPYDEASARALAAQGLEPTALHNNCSGKHAGFVCLGCGIAGGGVDLRQYLEGYVALEHPVMREVTSALAATTGVDLDQAPRGIDGRSIPTFAIPLRALALAFARIGSGTGLSPQHAAAARRLRRAVAREPFMVSGTGRMDTRVMQRFGERVFMKVGAEGMYCAALPELGLGLAIKIDDGNNARAAEVAVAAAIEAALAPDGDDLALLRSYSDATVSNWRGIEVGALRASAARAWSRSSSAW
ncbi:MAG TPA: asparaginase, partial [Burkholderiaceae bacterium]|nr:asparaginase [Burkholderiaceae bacterium]